MELDSFFGGELEVGELVIDDFYREIKKKKKLKKSKKKKDKEKYKERRYFKFKRSWGFFVVVVGEFIVTFGFFFSSFYVGVVVFFLAFFGFYVDGYSEKKKKKEEKDRERERGEKVNRFISGAGIGDEVGFFLVVVSGFGMKRLRLIIGSGVR